LISTAFAFYKESPEQRISSAQGLKEAKSLRFNISDREKKIKNEIQAMKSLDPKGFKQAVENSIANPPLYHSYLLEIRDGREAVEKAKLIAKKQLYTAVKNNWESIRQTVINDVGARNWKQFEPFLKAKLSEVIYTPAGSKNEFRFSIENWGYVKLKKQKFDIKTAQWELDVTTVRDENKLEEGADQITTSE
jgi:hypothetical protein